LKTVKIQRSRPKNPGPKLQGTRGDHLSCLQSTKSLQIVWLTGRRKAESVEGRKKSPVEKIEKEKEQREYRKGGLPKFTTLDHVFRKRGGFRRKKPAIGETLGKEPEKKNGENCSPP